MTNTLSDVTSGPMRGRTANVLPVVVVVLLPLAFGTWWWFARGEGAGDPQPAEATSEKAAEQPAATAGDPWLTLTQTIYPFGVIETIHQTDTLTYLFVRFTDRDRWVATSRTELQAGDRVQIEIPPRSIKENFKVKELDRVFSTIVLVGADRVKLQRAAAAGGTDKE